MAEAAVRVLEELLPDKNAVQRSDGYGGTSVRASRG